MYERRIGDQNVIFIAILGMSLFFASIFQPSSNVFASVICVSYVFLATINLMVPASFRSKLYRRLSVDVFMPIAVGISAHYISFYLGRYGILIWIPGVWYILYVLDQWVIEDDVLCRRA